MSASGTLDLANYSTVWDHNFSTQPNLNGFNTVWGDVTVQNGAAVLTSTAANGWPQAGFMITPSGASAGNGYGLYSITMSMNDNGAVEGPGGYACLWPSTNNWPGPELDLVEKQGADSGTNGYSTIHWAGAGNSNQYTPTMLGNIDVTQSHTYAMDWEPGRITMYVDGKEIYTTTQNVPKDYADGGQNEAFGAGEEPAWAASQQGGNSANQVQVYDISYSAYTPGSGNAGSSSSSGGGSGTSSGTSSPASGATAGTDTTSATAGTGTTSTGTTNTSTDTTGTAAGTGTTSIGTTSTDTTSAASTGSGAAAGATGTDTTGTVATATTGSADTSSSPAVNYVTAGSQPFFAAQDNQTVASGVSDQTVVLNGKGDTLVLGANGDQVLANNTGMTFYNEGQGTNQIYDLVGGNTFAPDPGASGTTITWDNALSNGDKFDLRYALNASGWNGNTADLGNYLTEVHGSWGMALCVHASGAAAGAPVLDIMGANANIDLPTFLQHATV